MRRQRYGAEALAAFSIRRATSSGLRHIDSVARRCANRLTIRRDVLEATVMDGLRHRLMDPALFKVFALEFTAEWNRLQAGAGASLCRAARRA